MLYNIGIDVINQPVCSFNVVSSAIKPISQIHSVETSRKSRWLPKFFPSCLGGTELEGEGQNFGGHIDFIDLSTDLVHNRYVGGRGETELETFSKMHNMTVHWIIQDVISFQRVN